MSGKCPTFRECKSFEMKCKGLALGGPGCYLYDPIKDKINNRFNQAVKALDEELK